MKYFLKLTIVVYFWITFQTEYIWNTCSRHGRLQYVDTWNKKELH